MAGVCVVCRGDRDCQIGFVCVRLSSDPLVMECQATSLKRNGDDCSSDSECFSDRCAYDSCV